MTYQLATAKVWDGSSWIPTVGSFPNNGDNVSGTSVLSICRAWTTQSPLGMPWPGGTMTIDGKALGSYDWVYKSTSQTIAASQPSDWFTSTQDSRSAWVIVDGDLTVNAGQVLRPQARKLFTVVYVTGDLTCNGTISMSVRGANHSGSGQSGGATTAADILIAAGTYSSVADPKVPSAGGAGAAGVSSANANGVTGTAGTGGGTGGGGSGGVFANPGTATSGAGAAGTSFSGGSGGGGAVNVVGGTITGGSGGSNGGAGGDSAHSGNNNAFGGAGNPGGIYTGGAAANNAAEGTGGVLIVIVEGALSGSGRVAANGVEGGLGVARTGGGSGGGHVTIMFGTDTSSITPTANGFAVSAFGLTSQAGGAGGAGTARKLAL
jgi:hypothetical protein